MKIQCQGCCIYAYTSVLYAAKNPMNSDGIRKIDGSKQKLIVSNYERWIIIIIIIDWTKRR